MYTNYNSELEKNQMFTPPIIGLTSSIVNDKLNNISLNDNNSSELFIINETADAIQTKDNIPLEASQFVITGANEEIDANENNAVNKRYLSTKINSLEDKYFLKSNIINKDQTPSNETVYSSLSTHTLLGEKSNTTYVDEELSKINQNIDLKANTEDVYDKTKIDYKLSLKANIEYVDQKVGIKANTIDVNNKLNLKANIDDVYNKNEIDNKISSLPTADNVYNKSEIDNKLSTINSNIDLKANTADVYNKTECDSRYIAIGSISKNIEVYPTINLLDLLDPIVSTKTSFTAYSPQRLFTINIPAESNVSLSSNNGITLWHLKFVLLITSTTTDKERLKELMMNLRLSVYIDANHHELSVKPQYYNDLTRYYIDSTFILNSLPTSDITLYIDGLTSISMSDLEILLGNAYTNYIYRIGLTA